MSLKKNTHTPVFSLNCYFKSVTFRPLPLRITSIFQKKKKKDFVSKYLPGFYQHDLIVYIWFCSDVIFEGNMPQRMEYSWRKNGHPWVNVFRKWGRKAKGQQVKLVHVWTEKPDPNTMLKVQLNARGWAGLKSLSEGNLRKKHHCPNELEKMLALCTVWLFQKQKTATLLVFFTESEVWLTASQSCCENK